MDKLTLEILSAYLPWGTRVLVEYYSSHPSKVFKFNSVVLTDYLRGSYNIKPLLRPLSDLYKEMEHEGERFVPAENLFNQYELKFGDNGDFYLDYYSIGETDSPWTGYGIIQQLLEWHFDVFGLIDRGMAVAIERGTNV